MIFFLLEFVNCLWLWLEMMKIEFRTELYQLGNFQAVGWLTSVPGASNTILEAVIPYCRMSLIQLLGKVYAYLLNLNYTNFLQICTVFILQQTFGSIIDTSSVFK